MGKFKPKLKNLIPSSLLCLYRERNYGENIKKYKNGMKYINKNISQRKKPKIVFLIQFPEVWNSIDTVYKAAEKAGAEPIILCVPKSKVNYSSVFVENEKNEAFEFFEKTNFRVVNAYNSNTKSWFDLEAEKPDYVIYARPYNKQYPNQYKSTSVCAYSKVCYIPYAFAMMEGGLTASSFNFDFLLTSYVSFVPSEARKKECKKRFAIQEMAKTNKFEFIGFPRFDLIKERLIDTKSETGEVKTILWLPRWSVDSLPGQKQSSFFEYFEPFMEYMEKNKDLNLIIRPHPLMFKVMAEKKILPEAEIEKLKKRVEDCDNVSFDEKKDYLFAFEKSDVLVSDYSSLLIEYFVTGKPMIYCDTAENFTQDARLMNSTICHAESWGEVEELLDKISKGADDKYEDRKAAITKIMPSNAGHIGEEIFKYICEDYTSSQGKNVGKF